MDFWVDRFHAVQVLPAALQAPFIADGEQTPEGVAGGQHMDMKWYEGHGFVVTFCKVTLRVIQGQLLGIESI